MRRLGWLPLGLAFAGAPAHAAAPGIFLAVTDRWDVIKLDSAVRDALAQAGFTLLPAMAQDALVLSIPDGVVRDNSATEYHFSVDFYRQGRKLGTSEERCDVTALKTCTDQLVSDAQSAVQASP